MASYVARHADAVIVTLIQWCHTLQSMLEGYVCYRVGEKGEGEIRI